MSAIVHCHAIRITEPGHGDQPVIVEWKVPDPEPTIPSPHGSHIVVTISPNIEPPLYKHDFAPEYAHDYTIVADGYTSSIDIGWAVDELCTVSDEGYLNASDEYGVEFWLRAQDIHDCGPSRPFDMRRWTVYRFPRCAIRSTVNYLEWGMVAHPLNGTISTMSTVLSIDNTKEES